jgi:hypothetical protein
MAKRVGAFASEIFSVDIFQGGFFGVSAQFEPTSERQGVEWGGRAPNFTHEEPTITDPHLRNVVGPAPFVARICNDSTCRLGGEGD